MLVLMWISFDLDGTLCDWPISRLVFSRMNQEFSTPELTAAFRLEYRERFASSQPITAFDWDDVHDAVTTRLGVPAMPRLLDLAAQAEWDSSLVFGDTRPALEKLDAKGYLFALGTNGLAKHQGYVLKQLDLELPVILAPDTTGYAKPQAGFLLELARIVDDETAIQGLIHVGDLLSHDVACANNAGATAVWVWRHMPPQLREIPVVERTARAEFVEAVRLEFDKEIAEHGGFGVDYGVPRPDMIVADLLELSRVLPAV
jgi:FMN hydrolase / 5-amino-6-(5-phospho-D-ribitylamino)uracil phosphatase